MKVNTDGAYIIHFPRIILSSNLISTSRFAVFLPVDKRFVRTVVVDNPFLLGREGGLCFDQKIFNVQGGRDAGQRHSLDPVVDNCPNHNSQAENTEHFDDEEDLQRHQALVVVREGDHVREREE